MALKAKPDPMSSKSKQTASGEARLIEGNAPRAREKCGCALGGTDGELLVMKTSGCVLEM